MEQLPEERLAPAGPRRRSFAAFAALPLGSLPAPLELPAAAARSPPRPAAPTAAAPAAASPDAGGVSSSGRVGPEPCVLFVTSVRAFRAVWDACRKAQKALEAQTSFEVVVKDVRRAPTLTPHARMTHTRARVAGCRNAGSKHKRFAA
jgi:hypothetical protein